MSDKVELKITGNATSATAALGQVSNSAKIAADGMDASSKKGARSMEEWGRSAQKLGAAIGAVSLLSLRASGEAEASQQRLVGAFQNSGIAIDEWTKRIELAQSAGLKLAFDDEDVADSLAVLVGVTGNAATAFKDLALAEDISRGAKISLAAATAIVQAAEEGRFRSMAQIGIKLDENATKEDYLAAATQRFAGASERFATTGAADWQRWQNAGENALEAIGAHIQTVSIGLLGLSAVGTIIGPVTGAISGMAAAAGVTGAAGSMTLLAGGLTTVGAAAVVAAPALIAVGLAVQSYRENMSELVSETDAITEAIKRLGATGADADFLQQLYGMVSQGSFNVEYTDEFSNRVFSLEEMFNELVSLQGEFQSGFVEMARRLEIDFANPAADDIENLIALILYFKQQQTQAYADADAAYHRGAGLSYRPPGSNRQPVVLDPALRDQYLSATNVQGGMQRLGEGSVRTAEAGQSEALAAATNLEKSLGAATQGVNSWSQAQANADRILKESLGGWYEMAKGVTTSGAALDAFKASQDGILQRETVYTQQISEFSSQVNAQDAAYEILNKRKQDGVAISEKEQKFLDNYAKANERGTGAVEDATIAAGELAQAYLLQMETGDKLNQSMSDNTGSVSDLVDTIDRLILSLTGIPEEVRTAIMLDLSDNSITDLINYYNYLSSLPGHVTTVIETVYQVSGTGGETRTRGSGSYLGGVIGAYGNGGVIAQLSEAGPEYVSFANGGGAWANRRGLYNLSRGDYVHTADASVGKPKGGGGTIVVNGDLHLHMHDANTYDAVRESATGGSR